MVIKLVVVEWSLIVDEGTIIFAGDVVDAVVIILVENGIWRVVGGIGTQLLATLSAI